MVGRSKKTDEDVLKWHDILEDFYTSKMTRQAFCAKNGLCYKEFNQYHSRIFYKSISEPEMHADLIKHVKSNKFKSMHIRDYVMAYKVERSHLREAQRFLSTQKLIQTHRPNSMLHLVYTVEKEPPPETRNSLTSGSWIQADGVWRQDAIPEVKHEKRNLEIISGTGIRVSIAEHTSAHNIAKIIECLNEIHD